MTHVVSAHTIDRLWDQARAMLADALRVLISPAEVLKRRARRVYAAITLRLRLLESVVVKVLLIEAGRTPISNPPPSSRAPVTSCAVRVACQEDPADASTWRVRFQVRLPPGAKADRTGAALCSPGKRRKRITQQRRRRLARRFEALRRVVADPRHAIAALARKLRTLGAAAYPVAHWLATATPRCASAGRAHAEALVFAVGSCGAFRMDTS